MEVQSWAVFGLKLLNAWAHSVQILQAPRYDRGAYADGKIFMKFRITAAWEGGKVYGFLLGFHTVNFVLSSRTAAKRK